MDSQRRIEGIPPEYFRGGGRTGAVESRVRKVGEVPGIAGVVAGKGARSIGQIGKIGLGIREADAEKVPADEIVFADAFATEFRDRSRTMALKNPV